MSHQHAIKKTHIAFIEFDDVLFTKLNDVGYFGEGNSKGRKLEFDFEYCLDCDYRLLNGQPVMTKNILDEELERLVIEAKNNKCVSSKETTVQHSDFETLEHLIEGALAFGKLKASDPKYQRRKK